MFWTSRKIGNYVSLQAIGFLAACSEAKEKIFPTVCLDLYDRIMHTTADRSGDVSNAIVTVAVHTSACHVFHKVFSELSW